MTDKLEALKAVKPADTQSLEAQAAGYVTDDNTGGYYVAECQECGAVYPSQQSAGGGQIADTGDYDDSYCPHCGQVDPDECDNVGLVWNVQQAKINALLAALEEKDQRIKELEGDVRFERLRLNETEIAALIKRADSAEQREGHLKADAAVLAQRNKELAEHNAELQQRLQQPIKLPKREIGMACEFVSDHIVVSLAAVLVEAATAGFKAEVEGE